MFFTYPFDLYGIYDVRCDAIFVIKNQNQSKLTFKKNLFSIGNIERRFEQEQLFV